MTRATRRGLVKDRGSASVETVIIAPAFVLFIGLLVFAARMGMAHQSVEAAAFEAARSASLARTATEARAASQAGASATLANQSLRCQSTNVSVDLAGFAAPIGTAGSVQATVTCVVDLSSVSLPGVPGTRVVTATATSPIDTYRERT